MTGVTGPGNTEPPLSRLADELTAVGERLAWIGYELRQMDAAARAYAGRPGITARRPGYPSRSGIAARPSTIASRPALATGAIDAAQARAAGTRGGQ